MADLFSLETRIVEQQTKTELNGEYAQKLIMKEVNKRSKDLDELCEKIKSIVFSDSEELQTYEYENISMKLSLLLYEFETQSEYADIRYDIAQMLEEERYNYLLASCKEKGTVSERQAVARSQVQAEAATSMITKHVSKLIAKKKTSAYELLGTVKKIITSRIASKDFNA